MALRQDCLLQLFAKAPLPGQVKTRMIPEIGIEAATAVYRHCLTHNLQLLERSAYAQQLWLDRPSDEPLFNGYDIHIQQGGDLGARMLHAFQSGFTRYRQVMLMGSDCLQIDHRILAEVRDRLDANDLVIVPARDGGYVLIAARHKIVPELFADIPWSTNRVLQRTLQACERCNIEVALLDPLMDIDHSADLQHYAELRQYL